MKCVCDEIRNDLNLTISDLALLFPDISKAVIACIVCDHLGLITVCACYQNIPMSILTDCP